MSRNLTQRQAAIEALLTNRTKTAAAEAAGVSRRTLGRWLVDPGFVADLRTAESQAVDEIGRRLAGIAATALDTLETVMTDDEVSAGVRYRAAVDVLGLFGRWREQVDTERRLMELEQRLTIYQ
ncbi:MAG: hypothetical protein KC547_14790 [Anaerolineae bacterium]|nr:hypothetical protein [Anaerolineae bacterium]